MSEMTDRRQPDFSYGIPHGYLELDLDPSHERATALFEQVAAMPDELRGQVEPMLRFYAGIVMLLDAQRVRGCAIGLHPDERGGAAFSALTASTLPISGAKPELVIASLGGSAADRPELGMRPMELPCGTGFFMERKRRIIAPGKPSDGSDGPAEGTIWQGTVAVTGPNPSSITTLQLVTPAILLAEDYRNVLLGVAHTLTFTDPSSGAEEEAVSVAPGSVAEAIKNEFG